VNVAPGPGVPRAADASARSALRATLLGERDAFVASAGFAAAAAALASHLRAALASLEPACLGLYWPMRSEFNAAAALADDATLAKVERALPYARRAGRAMEFRRWDGAAPTRVDECGIGASEGAVVVPDVVVVPCVGFTPSGHRLGSGAGYYDRWLAAHPHVVAVGVAWDFARIDERAFAAAAHDVALAFFVTESGAR